jgi:hypothetical protein
MFSMRLPTKAVKHRSQGSLVGLGTAGCKSNKPRPPLSTSNYCAQVLLLPAEASQLQDLPLQTSCLCYPDLHVVFADTCQKTPQKLCYLAVFSQITQALGL